MSHSPSAPVGWNKSAAALAQPEAGDALLPVLTVLPVERSALGQL
jgi:hypothetical protein